MDEMNITSFLSSRPWSFFLMAMENVVFTLCFTVFYVFHMTLLHAPHPPTPPSVNNNETFNVTPSSNQATSSRIQHHPTHFTLRYYTTPTPPPPHPPSVNNIETCNVTPSSNQATSSRIQHHPTHFTWRYYTPPTPPAPPICIQERTFWYSIKAEGSSKLRGTPSLEPIYIYIFIIYIYIYYNPLDLWIAYFERKFPLDSQFFHGDISEAGDGLLRSSSEVCNLWYSNSLHR